MEYWLNNICDIIGCYINFDSKEIFFSRNGKIFPPAFKSIQVGQVSLNRILLISLLFQ